MRLVKNTEVVVGDLLLLDTGDKLIADGVLVETHGLVVDEASLTGESDPIKKNLDEDPWCRSGTQVSEGSGRMIVVAVGERSEWGKTMALVGSAGSEDTPLQEKLADLAAAIGKVGFGVAVACFVALLVKWCVENRGFPLDQINNNGPVQFFLYAVTVVVVAVPEGLPLAVTIALAFSMKKMMRDNNFVRVLAACETMGGATAICSDKTGTLTENRMTVTEGWFAGTKHDHAPSAEELPTSGDFARELAANCALNSKAFLIEHGPDLPLEFVGNRTECALLALALRKWGVDYKALRSEAEEKGDIVHLYGFSSAKKMASVLVRQRDARTGAPTGNLRLYNKGAAEWVLRRCTRVVNPQGQVVPLPEDERERLISDVVVGMASRGLRCICLTYTDYPEKDPRRAADFFEDADRVDRDLVAMAIVGIKDPVRAEVPDAVRTCQKAGIFVRMVTGDNIHTARHIARECGILTDSVPGGGEGLAMEGPTFRAMPDEELVPLLPRLQVLARSSPEDKLVLVRALKTHYGEVVAVTGDGTNDAPALKESDVGLAMGIAGTEVAKEAADIVILDDNFSSIVKSVLWGRSVFNSIRKFLQFQLTVNFVALVVAFVGAVAGGRIPLNVLQLLWVNLIMDTMGALALATEDPNPALLDDRPHGRTDPLISGRMWKHILVQGLYQMLWLFLMMYVLPILPGPTFDRYRITSKCELMAVGPEHVKSPDPGYCVATMMAKRGIADANEAQQLCAQLLNCGWPCGKENRQTPACPASAKFPPGKVPADERDALGDAYPGFKKHIDFWRAQGSHEGEVDFRRADSVLFNTFIMLQVANEVNARRIKDEYNMFQGLHRSPIFLAVLAITLGLQAIIMQTPVGKFFKVLPLNAAEWGVCVAIGFTAFPVSLLTRVISQHCPPCLFGGNTTASRERRRRMDEELAIKRGQLATEAVHAKHEKEAAEGGAGAGGVGGSLAKVSPAGGVGNGAAATTAPGAVAMASRLAAGGRTASGRQVADDSAV